MKTQLFLSNDTDRNAIQKLKQNSTIKDVYLEKIQKKSSLCRDWERIKTELDNRSLGNLSRELNNLREFKWWNCSHNRLEQQTEQEKSKLKGLIYSFRDWENMVEFWYSIRNNLFHGSKDPEEKRDQFVVEYGYKTLKELIEILIYDK